MPPVIEEDTVIEQDQMWEPLENRILVRVIGPQEVTKSGIIIPIEAQEKSMQAEVIAVGAGRFENGNFVKTILNPGDIIFFGKYAGHECKMDGEPRIWMRESEVLAVSRSKKELSAAMDEMNN